MSSSFPQIGTFPYLVQLPTSLIVWPGEAFTLNGVVQDRFLQNLPTAAGDFSIPLSSFFILAFPCCLNFLHFRSNFLPDHFSRQNTKFPRLFSLHCSQDDFH